jgi:hypothetical protein
MERKSERERKKFRGSTPSGSRLYKRHAGEEFDSLVNCGKNKDLKILYDELIKEIKATSSTKFAEDEVDSDDHN